MFIPDPNFFHPGSRVKKIPDPGSGSVSNNWSILTWKIVSKLSEIWSRVVQCSPLIRIPDFGILIFNPSRIPEPGSRGLKGNGSRNLILNTGYTWERERSVFPPLQWSPAVSGRGRGSRPGYPPSARLPPHAWSTHAQVSEPKRRRTNCQTCVSDPVIRSRCNWVCGSGLGIRIQIQVGKSDQQP